VHLLNEKKIRNQKHIPNLGDGVSQLDGGQVVCAHASNGRKGLAEQQPPTMLDRGGAAPGGGSRGEYRDQRET
jgi:hypothetical protein